MMQFGLASWIEKALKLLKRTLKRYVVCFLQIIASKLFKREENIYDCVNIFFNILQYKMAYVKRNVETNNFPSFITN